VTTQHAGLTLERWLEFDEPRRLLMIANELHRAAKWSDPEDGERRRAAIERVLALTDLTIAAENRPTHLRELLRWRDCAAAAYLALADAPSDRELLRALLRFHPAAATQIPFVAA
jgi:hypothetical protein